jgi:hypothetical protein
VCNSQSSPDMSMYLTSWQERHALLVCQSVREINELRCALFLHRNAMAIHLREVSSASIVHVPHAKELVPTRPVTLSLAFAPRQVCAGTASTD